MKTADMKTADMKTAENSPPQKKPHPLWRGIRGLCPHCGQGKIFKSYITQHKECAICHEDFSNICADDAPPWLTILITGHIMAPLVFYFVTHDVFSERTETGILVAIALLCIFIILPRSKGLFIAAIWLLKKRKNSPS